MSRLLRWQFLSRFFGDCAITVILPKDGTQPIRVEIIQ